MKVALSEIMNYLVAPIYLPTVSKTLNSDKIRTPFQAALASFSKPDKNFIWVSKEIPGKTQKVNKNTIIKETRYVQAC